MKKLDLILILDFGSQYTQLIARRIRELKVYCEIHPYSFDAKKIAIEGKYNLKGVILSGGPASVLDKNSPKIDETLLEYFTNNKIPVLGVCYGLQLISFLKGGKISKSKHREYGHSQISLTKKSLLFSDTRKNSVVWMSHGDSLNEIPKGFAITSKSINGVVSSIEHTAGKVYCVQFHPEVNHTEEGKKIISNFVFKICDVKNKFTPSSFIEEKIREVKNTSGNSNVICALSGGVDSSVAAILVHRAIGEKLHCIHIDNGLMRKNESRKVVELFRKNFKIKVKLVDASKLFLSRLKGIKDPEKKRKIIGKTFIDVFEREAKRIKSVKYLVQGTLYPDVIESVSFKGPSAVIKTHHNVGGLPAKMNLKLIEPFRELFKDEVREIGLKLGLPKYFINRHPFPGPGLAIRILSDVTKSKLELLRDIDEIYMEELRSNNLYDKIWQAFSVLMPVQTVGVMGDERSYENVAGIRAVTSTDGMTADFFDFSQEFLRGLSNRIINEVKGINRVVYDISTKPPATIEWE
ncbi:MAG: glutamine-hydrolyzing GMP synthase [Bacteroidetes bacterium]|nr:glutamine-hydrolyzing GMP synthase [Bacteroidota bacterium]